MSSQKFFQTPKYCPNSKFPRKVHMTHDFEKFPHSMKNSSLFSRKKTELSDH